MDTTFKQQQEYYRVTLSGFFSSPELVCRLERIFDGGDRLANVIYFFVKQYNPGRLVQTNNEITCMSDEYSRAISSHKKRFYNFVSRVGVKDGKEALKWNGEVNPAVEIGRARMSLPRMIGMYWFILHGYDILLWENYDDVNTAYTKFTTQTKQKYAETHKSKKFRDRKKFEKMVIAERSETFMEKRRGKKRVYLTQAERQRVREIAEEEKQKKKLQKCDTKVSAKDSDRYMKKNSSTYAPPIDGDKQGMFVYF